MIQQPENKLEEAIQLHKAGKDAQSRELLQKFLLEYPKNLEALLWLARVSPDSQEALYAAELAYCLSPGNEIAQRAITAVHQRVSSETAVQPRLELLKLTGMTPSQARAVNWPFRKGLNRPIGVLLDEGVIKPNDLAYAVEKAYDENVRRAARTLLLETLLAGEESVFSESVRVIKGEDFTGRQERTAMLNGGITLGGIFTLVLLSFILLLDNWFFHILPGPTAGAFGWVITLIVFGLGILGMRWADEALNYRSGGQAEKDGVDILRASLPQPWALFQNYTWPTRRWGDVDIILVGPGGLWVFEVKAYSAEVRNIGKRWLYKSRYGTWLPMSKNPGRQAQRNAMNVKNHLEGSGIPVGWVQPIVIWASSEGSLALTDPVVPVWKLIEIGEHIEELWGKSKLEREKLDTIITVLESQEHDRRD